MKLVFLLGILMAGCSRYHAAVECPRPEVKELEQWAKTYQFHLEIDALHQGERTKYYVHLWPKAGGKWPDVKWAYVGVQYDLAAAVREAKNAHDHDDRLWYSSDETREVLCDK